MGVAGRIVLAFLLGSFHPVTFCNAQNQEVANMEHPFTYVKGDAKGPENWGKLDPQWTACGTGKLQSPIDLDEQRVQLLPDLGTLEKSYKPALALVNNSGHDVSLHWKGDAGGLDINGTVYKLVKCHWHTPSEHSIGGKHFDMEMHMLHQDSAEKKAVIGILFELGLPDPFLAKIIPNIKRGGKSVTDVGMINPDEVKLGSQNYYRYIGSLTAPPCSENVIWSVSDMVMTVSKEQVQVLKDAVDDGFEANARPVQNPGGRSVSLYKANNQ